jgi:hypothetical protein
MLKATLKLVILAGLVLMSFVVASAMRLMPHDITAETMTPQQEYFRLHNDDGLVADLLAAPSRRTSGLAQGATPRFAEPGFAFWVELCPGAMSGRAIAYR